MADTPGAHIGLNEPQIGLTVPELWAQLLVNTIGFRQAELLATNGAVVGPAEAKRVGLVDLVVPAGKEAGLVGTAETVLQEWLKLPSLGRSLTKLAIRKPLADKLRDVEVLNKQVDAGWVFLSNPNTIKVMKATLDRLQGSKL
ncbi:dodecenoyl-CoA isomerase [Physocladia obscura]|uniref:Dodecenoyl-CoA isomerase n=1 Tax=Physocladia obscura TaxID=109957 RepID=A0AAD5XH71_9FUNG|nr:dodecenoyl-CoA isomerase [Physocladia obscura]